MLVTLSSLKFNLILLSSVKLWTLSKSLKWTSVTSFLCRWQENQDTKLRLCSGDFWNVCLTHFESLLCPLTWAFTPSDFFLPTEDTEDWTCFGDLTQASPVSVCLLEIWNGPKKEGFELDVLTGHKVTTWELQAVMFCCCVWGQRKVVYRWNEESGYLETSRENTPESLIALNLLFSPFLGWLHSCTWVLWNTPTFSTLPHLSPFSLSQLRLVSVTRIYFFFFSSYTT